MSETVVEIRGNDKHARQVGQVVEKATKNGKLYQSINKLLPAAKLPLRLVLNMIQI